MDVAGFDRVVATVDDPEAIVAELPLTVRSAAAITAPITDVTAPAGPAPGRVSHAPGQRMDVRRRRR